MLVGLCKRSCWLRGAAMPDGVCQLCGQIFDLLQGPCPICQRCPECGCKWSEGVGSCSNCAHPTDEFRLLDLERRLDPDFPENQREIQSFERRRENELILTKFSTWKMLVIILIYCVGVVLVNFLLIVVPGLNQLWSTILTTCLSLPLLYSLLCWLRRRGRLEWLDRTEK